MLAVRGYLIIYHSFYALFCCFWGWELAVLIATYDDCWSWLERIQPMWTIKVAFETNWIGIGSGIRRQVKLMARSVVK